MILIISEENDVTTDRVIDWLLHYNIEFERINDNKASVLSAFKIDNSGVDLTINSRSHHTYTSVWQRRGAVDFFKIHIDELSSKNGVAAYDSLLKYLSKEKNVISNSIEGYLKKTCTSYIGSFEREMNTNKIEVLLLAKELGLQIPKTLITTSKEELVKFYTENKNIITKDLFQTVHFQFKNEYHNSIGTFVVTEQMIHLLEAQFFPIFVQEKIEKKYEIRSFLYKEKIFSMAIFSQNDDTTAVDYRNYNHKKPNRAVPIQLPKQIEKKLIRLTSKLSVNTCSVDIIVNKNNEYIFLEINPMGQFDWLSKNCNYYIEKMIAEDLIGNEYYN